MPFLDSGGTGCHFRKTLVLFIVSALSNPGASEGPVKKLRGFRRLLISGGLDRSNRDTSTEQGSPPSYINTTTILQGNKAWASPIKQASLANRAGLPHTVEPRYNEPLQNKVLGTTNDFLQPGQRYNKMYGTEPRCDEPRFNEILDITNTIQKRKRKYKYLDITNKCQHVTER